VSQRASGSERTPIAPFDQKFHFISASHPLEQSAEGVCRTGRRRPEKAIVLSEFGSRADSYGGSATTAISAAFVHLKREDLEIVWH
jgi:hypothetical protein